MKSRSGFTIVELLVVIAVIATLAGIAMVAYPALKNRAEDTKRRDDVRNIKQSVNTHLSKEHLPRLLFGVKCRVDGTDFPGVGYGRLENNLDNDCSLAKPMVESGHLSMEIIDNWYREGETDPPYISGGWTPLEQAKFGLAHTWGYRSTGDVYLLYNVHKPTDKETETVEKARLQDPDANKYNAAEHLYKYRDIRY